jgi:acetyl esterase/lipase
MPHQTGPRPPYPIHKSVAHLVDPEYTAFYNKHIINNQQVHYQPVSASRTSGVLLPGAGPAQTVGSTKNYAIERQESQGQNVAVRVFTPEGTAPQGGWPIMVYFHGGGWVLGNINTENVVCSHLCSRASCVVISVDYRYVFNILPNHAMPLMKCRPA